LIYGELNHTASWLSGDLWTELGASFSRTEDGDVPSALAIKSNAQRFYLRASVPVLRARDQSLWLGLTFDARHSDEDDPSGPNTDENTRVLRGSLTYTVLDAAGRNDILVELSQGIGALGASSNEDPFLTRPDGRPQFTKLRLDVSRLQKLAPGLDLLLSAAGQLADGPLVSAEEFGAGGARFGRAYDYSEITGDDGAAGSAEVRYTFQNVLETLASLQLYGFADTATIRNEGANPLTFRSASLSSAGFGFRLMPVAGLTANVEVARPLSREVAEEGNKNARVFVSLTAGW
jgi:hemolysin activation/secretion protein